MNAKIEPRKLTRADREAADWIVRLNARDASQADRVEHQAWLEADLRNEYAYRVQQQYWEQLPAMRKHDRYDELIAEPFYERWALAVSGIADRCIESLRRPRTLVALGSFALVALVAVTLLVDQTAPVPEPQALATNVAEIRELTLADGSTVTLGAQSQIRVAFTETERNVTLTAGEAFFDVESDPARAFLVEAGDSIARVVGTQFDVRLGAETVSIAVAEGQVDVSRIVQAPDESAAPVMRPAASLMAGQKIVLQAGLEAAVETSATQPDAQVREIDTADIALWREGRLNYVETRLADVVADINRYYEGEIILGDDRVGELEFTASLRAEEVETLLNAIIANMPVEAVRRANGRVILTAADPR